MAWGYLIGNPMPNKVFIAWLNSCSAGDACADIEIIGLA